MAWLRWFLLGLTLATPLAAGPLPGAEAPAFKAAFDQLLTHDDPAALAALYDLAAAGNAAALLALPLADRWLPATAVLPETDLLPDRQALRRVGGQWVSDLNRTALQTCRPLARRPYLARDERSAGPRPRAL